jgi:hypothetical protein
MQDSGQPEDAGTAKPEGAGTEATRGTISRRRRRENLGQPEDSNPRQSRKVKARGNPPPHQEAHLETRSRGATRSNSARSAEGREKRGNSRLRCRHSRKMQKPGQPGESIGRRNWKGVAAGETPGYGARCAEGWEIRGDSKIHRRQGRKVRRPGQPGGSISRRNRRSEVRGNLSFTAGCAEGRETRGNSKIGRRQSLRMQDAGQLATSSGGTTGRA